MGDYKTGTVAMVTAANQPTPYRAYFDGRVWRELDGAGFCLVEPVTCRPLVLLDLEGHTLPAGRLREIADRYLKNVYDHGFKLLTALADQIEAQTKPPRIDEPGLWGVVEAIHPQWPTRRWMRHEEDHWINDRGAVVTWDDLIDPTLVREGIES